MGLARTSVRRLGARTLTAAVTLGSVAYFVLFACAPPAAMRPGTPMLSHQRNEFGMSASGGARLDVDSSSSAGTGGGQIWYSSQQERMLDFGMVAYGGYTDRQYAGGGGLGATIRVRIFERDSFRLAFDMSGGWLWGELGFPVAVRLVNGVWLYSAPSFGAMAGFDDILFVRPPVGLSVALGRDWSLLAELSPQIALFDGNGDTGAIWLRGSLGTTYRF